MPLLTINTMKYKKLPHVSFIIPCRPNIEPSIALNSIKVVDYPHDRIEVIIEKGRNPPAQRNRGIKKAKGEIIAFVDDDCDIKSNWLLRATGYFKDDAVGIVGGPNLTPENDSLFAHCVGYALSSYFGTAKMSYRYRYNPRGKARICSEESIILCNMLCKKEVFDNGIYFNEALFPNEENEFILRVNKLGYKAIYAPDVQVYHPRKKDFAGFAKQLMNYGYGRGRQIRIQPDSFKPTHILPSLFTFALLALPISFILNLPVLNQLLISCFFVYLCIAVSIGAITAVKKKDPRIAFILPFIFIVLHISYGLGFIKGIAIKKIK